MKKKNESVIIKVYDQEMSFESRKKAFDFFYEGMLSADPGSSEWCRYAHICYGLQNTTKTYITDGMED